MPTDRASDSGVVLGVGNAAVDIIHQVDVYPPEDAEVRARSQQVARGGNCANSLVVAAQLGRRCRFVGTLAADAGAGLIAADLHGYGIDMEHAVRHPTGATPTSYIALSRASASRTIIHHRDLPEIAAADFAAVPTADCIWAHFEGRNPEQTATMIRRLRQQAPSLPISIEIEKPRPALDRLLDAAGAAASGPLVMIFSRAYAQIAGASDPMAFIGAQSRRLGALLSVLPWGAGGAYLAVRDNQPDHIPADKIDRVVDTLAAGDVFNAGLIDSLLDGHAPMAAVARANRLAGYKCSRHGLDDLVADARRDGAI